MVGPAVRGYFDRAAVSRRIRQAREDRGLSRAEVAAALGVHQNTVNGWEDPKLRPLPIDNRGDQPGLNELAEILQVSPGWLLHGDDWLHQDEDLAVQLAELRELVSRLLERSD